MDEGVREVTNCLAAFYNLPVLITFCLASLTIYMYRTFWRSSGSKAIPGPWCLPLVGYFPFLGEKPHLTLTRLGNKYGPVFRLSLGMKDVVVINSRKLAREALVGKGDDFADRPQFKLRNILPKNSNFSFLPFGESWKLQHKTIVTAWNRCVQTSRGTIEELITCEVQHLEARVHSSISTHLVNDLRRSVFSIIYQVCYGRSANIHTNRDFLHMLQLYEKLPIFPIGNNLFHFINFMPWISYFLPAYERNLRTGLKHISDNNATKIKQVINTQENSECFAHHLGKMCQENAENLSENILNGIFLSINAIVAAATFPPLNVLANALILMAEYPDVQQRVRKEIHSVVSNDQHPSWKDHLSLPFTEAVLLETLRFRPREGVILPHSTLRNTSLCGFDIKKDTCVLFNVHAMHLDQTDWHNPEEFIPERFLDSNGKVSPSTYSKLMTFSAGRRKCIGETFAKMELFLFFTGILQKCEFNKGTLETDSITNTNLEDISVSLL